MSMNQKVSIAVLAKVSEGMDVIEALKSVCGADKVDAMITDLYCQLQA